jgi:transposase
MGARAVLQSAARLNDPLSRWALAVQQSRGYHRACIAIAAKNARVAWALLAKDSVIAKANADNGRVQRNAGSTRL